MTQYTKADNTSIKYNFKQQLPEAISMDESAQPMISLALFGVMPLSIKQFEVLAQFDYQNIKTIFS
ncbi:hypothetical protein EQG49_02725 [Periweissella cryptocerci]|uniref:Uncharacterized protein n=1 Tax=Periweissella cryptocerci TaxID=2506420 RepID=A0A4P6YS42_9LACO|nr:hypothetical protein [Periweissella cryptocerci]QBO35456.1 hypothetical protein EQG49_02725 [Periweissella cryptocerci]